jgi:hypothetical protein
MKLNFWTVLGIVIIAATVVVWIIPAILEWQRNENVHEERMTDMNLELERIRSNKKNDVSFLEKVKGFFGKTIVEILPTIAGKFIG